MCYIEGEMFGVVNSQGHYTYAFELCWPLIHCGLPLKVVFHWYWFNWTFCSLCFVKNRYSFSYDWSVCSLKVDPVRYFLLWLTCLVNMFDPLRHSGPYDWPMWSTSLASVDVLFTVVYPYTHSVHSNYRIHAFCFLWLILEDVVFATVDLWGTLRSWWLIHVDNLHI